MLSLIQRLVQAPKGSTETHGYNSIQLYTEGTNDLHFQPHALDVAKGDRNSEFLQGESQSHAVLWARHGLAERLVSSYLPLTRKGSQCPGGSTT